MPSTYEGLLAFFGFILIVATLFSGTLSWNGATIDALTGNKKKVVRVIGCCLLLFSVFLFVIDKVPVSYTIKQKKNLDRFEISQFLAEKNLTQYQELPIYAEIFNFKRQGESSYQILICADNGSQIAVPRSIDYCPSGRAGVSPRNGPIIQLSDYSD